jgi:hypothetical protein
LAAFYLGPSPNSDPKFEILKFADNMWEVKLPELLLEVNNELHLRLSDAVASCKAGTASVPALF